MKGRWAQGLEPRYFCWIIKDRLAASERPGGFARNHRKVRRQEELIWLAGTASPTSCRSSTRRTTCTPTTRPGIAYEHVPLGRHDELADRLHDVYAHARPVARRPRERVLMHHEEFGDRLLGVVAGLPLYSGLVHEGPHAIAVLEKLTGRQLGSVGREIVAVTVNEGLFRYPRPAPERLPQPAEREAATTTTAKARSTSKGAKPATSGKAKKAASVRGKKAKA